MAVWYYTPWRNRLFVFKILNGWLLPSQELSIIIVWVKRYFWSLSSLVRTAVVALYCNAWRDCRMTAGCVILSVDASFNAQAAHTHKLLYIYVYELLKRRVYKYVTLLYHHTYQFSLCWVDDHLQKWTLIEAYSDNCF